jgi:hypothetical protein
MWVSAIAQGGRGNVRQGTLAFEWLVLMAQHAIAGKSGQGSDAMEQQKTQGRAEEVLAQLDPSQPRRIIGVDVQLALGAVLISLAISFPREQMALRIGMLILGGLVFYGSYLTWQATAAGLVLTKSGLRDANGRVLAEMANIREVSRGAFALKPSHGFSLVLFKGTGFAWVPGLWWRIGSRVGIGGVTPSQPARYMAEMISGIIAERDQ